MPTCPSRSSSTKPRRLPQNAALDEFESVEGLSGTRFNDVLTGTDDDGRRSRCRSPRRLDGLPRQRAGRRGHRPDQRPAGGARRRRYLLRRRRHHPRRRRQRPHHGPGGDDIIDGDKWLDVQIGVFAAGDRNHTGAPIALHNSMTTLAASMFDGIDQSWPARDRPRRSATATTSRTATGSPMSIVRCVLRVSGELYDIASNADGTIDRGACHGHRRPRRPTASIASVMSRPLRFSELSTFL